MIEIKECKSSREISTAPKLSVLQRLCRLIIKIHGLEGASRRVVFFRLPKIVAFYYLLLGLTIASPIYDLFVVPGDIHYCSLDAASLFPSGFPAKDISIQAKDGSQLRGIMLSPKIANGNLIIFSHGNLCSVIDSTDNLAKELVARGYSVLFYDYRGYGDSGGKRSIAGVLDDGLSAYDTAVSKFGFSPDHIILIGESLGTAVSCKIASNRKVKSVVLLSPFTSIPDIVRSKLNIYPNWIFRKPSLDNLEMAKRINCPILAVCGKWDFLIPNRHSVLIARVAAGPAKVIRLPNTGHAVELNGLDRELLRSELLSFLNPQQ